MNISTCNNCPFLKSVDFFYRCNIYNENHFHIKALYLVINEERECIFKLKLVCNGVII